MYGAMDREFIEKYDQICFAIFIYFICYNSQSIIQYIFLTVESIKNYLRKKWHLSFTSGI